jgi:hypothetical protein
MVRSLALLVGLTAGLQIALPAMAGEMSAEEARHFVTGKLFSYTCFEGTRGQGRVLANGGVVGSVQFQGSGPMRYAALPANTLQVKDGAVCASVRGLPFQPCFNLDKTDVNSFRGSISGLGFAYCDFVRHQGRTNIAHRVSNEHQQPLALRPSVSATSD